MIILLLLILLSRNKYSRNFYTSDYLFLFLILLLSDANYNTLKTSYIPKKIYNNPNYNNHNNLNNYIPYDNSNYLNCYNNSPRQEFHNRDNTYCSNKYYQEKQYYDNIINHSYDKPNKEQCISIETNEKTKPIDTISSKNNSKLTKQNLPLNIPNDSLIIEPTSKSTTINSIINKNINNDKSITIVPIKNNKSYSLDCTKKVFKKSPIKINNISKGQTITVLIESFGLITGKLLSTYNDVISLRLDDNKTLFINTNFISYFY